MNLQNIQDRLDGKQALPKFNIDKFVPFALTAGELRALCEGNDSEVARVSVHSVALFPDAMEVVCRKEAIESLVAAKALQPVE